MTFSSGDWIKGARLRHYRRRKIMHSRKTRGSRLSLIGDAKCLSLPVELADRFYRTTSRPVRRFYELNSFIRYKRMLNIKIRRKAALANGWR